MHVLCMFMYFCVCACRLCLCVCVRACVCTLQDVHASDPDAAEYCIDLHENELIVVTRKGTHGWIFGRVVHNETGVPIEDGREGWWGF